MKPLDSTGWQLNRRRFLGVLSAVGVGGLLGSAGAAAGPLITRPIPSSGQQIPVIGLGTYRAFDVRGSGSALQAQREVLRRFHELGGSVVDSSPMYGEAERVLGELGEELGLSNQLFWATKVWTRGKAAGIAEMNHSFALLRTRRIELMQIHNLLDWETHLPVLRDWKAEGRFGYLGFTHYTESAYPDLERLIRREKPDFVQFNYSIERREAEARLLPACADNGVAVLVNRPFVQGALFRRIRNVPLPAWVADMEIHSWAQLFLKFIVSHPAVTSTIPATSKVSHLEDNMGAGVGRLPNTQEREQLAQLVRAL